MIDRRHGDYESIRVGYSIMWMNRHFAGELLPVKS